MRLPLTDFFFFRDACFPFAVNDSFIYRIMFLIYFFKSYYISVPFFCLFICFLSVPVHVVHQIGNSYRMAITFGKSYFII